MEPSLRSDVTPSVTGARPLPSPEMPAGMAASAPRRRLSGPLVYYLLAAFDVLTVSASLYLNHRIMAIYVDTVRVNAEWAQRVSTYSALGELAAQVNAPGNDVFASRDVAGEAVRLQRARLTFEQRMEELHRELTGNVNPADAQALLARMQEIEVAMQEMTAEASLIFAHFAGGHNELAGQRMATMDRKYASVLGALRDLRAAVSAIQEREFGRQTAAASTLQRFEYLIAGLIFIMVSAATVYGRMLSQHAARESGERAVYIEGLQAAEESLRKAHAHLEKRVQERTHALRASEAALRAAAAEWQRTFEAIDSPVMILDGAGRAVRLNRAAGELAGRPPGELVGQPVRELGHGEPWATAAAVAETARARRAPDSAQARDEDSGRTWDVSANLVPEGDGRGGEHVIVVAGDITHVIELQESVRREERMAAMGSLVAGVAHEVRNPLFGITSTLDAFEARHGQGEPFRKYLTLLRRETERLSALMRDLLDYGRPPGLDMRAADLAAVVDESIQLCQPIAGPAGVRVVREGDAPSRVRLDRWRMQQALQNVIQNAIQHTPPGGTVTVTVGHAAEGDKRQVSCSVRDSGPGFKAEDLPHLFEPFFTRRPGGTGMGLSLAQRIVSQHGGRLQARNHAQGGAVMTITLPAEAAEQAAAV